MKDEFWSQICRYAQAWYYFSAVLMALLVLTLLSFLGDISPAARLIRNVNAVVLLTLLVLVLGVRRKCTDY
jgi:uncharacterized membrane protein